MQSSAIEPVCSKVTRHHATRPLSSSVGIRYFSSHGMRVVLMRL